MNPGNNAYVQYLFSFTFGNGLKTTKDRYNYSTKIQALVCCSRAKYSTFSIVTENQRYNEMCNTLNLFHLISQNYHKIIVQFNILGLLQRRRAPLKLLNPHRSFPFESFCEYRRQSRRGCVNRIRHSPSNIVYQNHIVFPSEQ